MPTTKQVHLAAHFPGVNNITVWSDPRSESQIDFGSFLRLAQTAERGKFDFFFLAEGLRLRELPGRLHRSDAPRSPGPRRSPCPGRAIMTELHFGLAGPRVQGEPS
jgi:alkanesulfonate monooxygenase SsuD/methylene tetrahydromethanopterin reductase-like flavin-dependent oxidoreductase (luciferase family)